MEKLCTICGGVFNDSVDTCPTDHKRLVLNPRRFIGATLATRYLVTQELHLDDFMLILLARDQRLTRDVIIKTLSVNPEQFPNRLNTLNQEQAAYCKLDDPRFPRVYDMGELRPGWPFVVYERLMGRRLEDIILDQAPIDPSRAAALALQIASALALAHSHGLIHGALSPGCIYISTDPAGLDQVRICDFGLTRITGSQPDLPAGRVIRRGRDEYTSPEQWRGEQVSAQTDVYGLGLMLYEMLAGKRPFDASNRQDLRAQILGRRAPRIRDRSPSVDVPGALDDAVVQMIARHADDRPADMVEVCHLLVDSIEPRATEARTASHHDAIRVPPLPDTDLAWLAGPLDEILPERPLLDASELEVAEAAPVEELAEVVVAEDSGPYTLEHLSAVTAPSKSDEEYSFDDFHSRPTDPLGRILSGTEDVTLHFRDTDPLAMQRHAALMALELHFRDTGRPEPEDESTALTVEAVDSANAPDRAQTANLPVWIVHEVDDEFDPAAVLEESARAVGGLPTPVPAWRIAAAIAVLALASGAGAAWWFKRQSSPTLLPAPPTSSPAEIAASPLPAHMRTAPGEGVAPKPSEQRSGSASGRASGRASHEDQVSRAHAGQDMDEAVVASGSKIPEGGAEIQAPEPNRVEIAAARLGREASAHKAEARTTEHIQPARKGIGEPERQPRARAEATRGLGPLAAAPASAVAPGTRRASPPAVKAAEAAPGPPVAPLGAAPTAPRLDAGASAERHRAPKGVKGVAANASAGRGAALGTTSPGGSAPEAPRFQTLRRKLKSF